MFVSREKTLEVNLAAGGSLRMRCFLIPPGERSSSGIGKSKDAKSCSGYDNCGHNSEPY
jgi:hypothetical protein